MVTVYGTDKTRPEDLPALLSSRKMVHPVLLDPTAAFRKATGVPVYPMASLLDRDGRIVWEGNTDRTAFGKACEAELEALFAGIPVKEAGPASKRR